MIHNLYLLCWHRVWHCMVGPSSGPQLLPGEGVVRGVNGTAGCKCTIRPRGVGLERTGRLRYGRIVHVDLVGDFDGLPQGIVAIQARNVTVEPLVAPLEERGVCQHEYVSEVGCINEHRTWASATSCG